jgi:ATP-dependent Clp protease adaptor protein ClpS
MRATGCGFDEAYMEMWEAHHFGKAPCHFASQPDCETVAETISSIGVETEVLPEWEE